MKAPALFAVLLLTGLAPRLSAQVEAYTVGVSMCCPYGMGECWTIVRDGLERLDGIQFIADDASVSEQTGQFKVREGTHVDSDTLMRLFARHRIPADVRGVEITAAGRVRLVGEQWMFEVAGASKPIILMPLTRKVQWDSTANRSGIPTDAESAAFAALTRKTDKNGLKVRITGPLIRKSADTMALEVRVFEELDQNPKSPKS